MEQERAVVGLGEVLWDVFPQGARFGGAPANFACAVAGLGIRSVSAWMASSVGHDDLGNQVFEALRDHNVDASCVTRSDRPTGTVTVSLNPEGSANYEFALDTAWDNIAFSAEQKRLAARANAVCFGTLGQRSQTSRTSIQRFVSETSTDALRIFDVNLRPPYFTDDVIAQSLELCNVLKMNEEELPILAQSCGLRGTPTVVMLDLVNRFNLTAIALTRGQNGAILIRDGEVAECSGIETDVVDTVGAGDAFTAVLATGLLLQTDLEVINRNACRVAAHVCSQPGATPKLSAQLLDSLPF